MFVYDNDCDDTEALAWTGNTEICDYVDNDCNGQTDEGLLSLFYVDLDGDGYGNPNTSAAMCSLIAGYSINSNDCDDTEALAWTGNTEICDYVDNDCNGSTDEGVLTTYYQDDDEDGYGNPNSILEDCSQPVDFVLNDNDCNDSDDLAWSGNTESCDYVDNDCNGQTDEGVQITYYQDNDLDGYGNPNSTTQDCTQPIGYVDNTYDCNDAENLAFTGASESCDYVDNDCNGSTDEGVQTTYYQDFDGDGYGNISVVAEDCSPPIGYVSNSTDCYDLNYNAKPPQTGFFTTDRGDGSFDYDCDGLESQGLTQSGSCDWWDFCGLEDAGWNGSPPDCGDTGDFMYQDEDCSYGCWLNSCCDKGGNTATQPCR